MADEAGAPVRAESYSSHRLRRIGGINEDGWSIGGSEKEPVVDVRYAHENEFGELDEIPSSSKRLEMQKGGKKNNDQNMIRTTQTE